MSDEKALGWDAITARFDTLYPEQTNPLHFGTIIPAMLGGNDPLHGISVYDAGDFWHFVTYGFSDLWEKEGDDPEWSGFGMELTMKLKKLDWVDDLELKNIAGVLQSLARYVFSSGNAFLPYEYIWTKQTEGFDAGQKSKLTGFATASDEAGIIETPHGKVEFICVVGLTDKELRSINEKEINTQGLLEKLGNHITDYERDDVI